jgi:hypothetical protein
MATRRGPDNSVRFSIAGLINNVPWANVFWSQLTTSGTPTQTDLDTWLTAVQAAYKTQFAPNIQTSVTFTQAQALLFLPGALTLPSLIAMTGAGTGTPQSGDPSDVCWVISWQTGVYWRGGKPRTYIPAPPVSLRLDHRALTTVATGNLATTAGAFRTAVNAATAGAITGSSLGFVSFRSAKADRVPPVFFSYSGAKVHPRLGTQRRRLGRWQP